MKPDPLYNAARGVRLFNEAKTAIRGDGEASKFARALDLGTAATGAWRNAQEIYTMAKAKACYTVAVSAEGEEALLYSLTIRWLTQNMPERRRRALVAHWDRNRGGVVGSYDGQREQFITIGGHRVAVAVSTKGVSDISGGMDTWDLYARYKNPERIVFTALTTAGRDAVLALLSELMDDWSASRMGLPDLYLFAHRGWSRTGDLLPRSLDSVVLAPGQIERIISTLETFESMEERYLDLGLPWHTGMLFYGPPGTGKSSIARAIASHLGRDLHYLSLTSLESDEALFDCVARVPPGAILLLEDVDTMGGVDNRDLVPGLPHPQRKGVTMSGVLNVLDGVMTPHGLVKIMSTNHLEALDPAVYRRGRVDLVEEIGYATAEMAERIFHYAFPDHPPVAVTEMADGISPAKLVGALKPHLTDPAAAEGVFLRLCSTGDDPEVSEALHSVRPNAAAPGRHPRARAERPPYDLELAP